MGAAQVQVREDPVRVQEKSPERERPEQAPRAARRGRDGAAVAGALSGPGG
eukprot:COSAG05_NODE_13552_length_426_cov_0.513761_1_plen_50_part_01